MTCFIRSQCIGPRSVAAAERKNEEAHLNLLSGQLYSDVIAGRQAYCSDSFLDNNISSSASEASDIPPNSPANSPYIIGFYDAYIDPEYGAVSLVLEYMNGGSIQQMLQSGIKFDEKNAAVLAFSVLSALVELHSRNILHRDIKPSNILIDHEGRIKLTDFGITKGDPSRYLLMIFNLFALSGFLSNYF